MKFRKYLGLFKTQEEAAKVVNAAQNEATKRKRDTPRARKQRKKAKK